MLRIKFNRPGGGLPVIYMLEKVATKLGKKSQTEVGSVLLGERCLFYKDNLTENKLEIKIESPTPSDITPGGRIMVLKGKDFVRTSDIINIMERTHDFIMFETDTSIYTLGKSW